MREICAYCAYPTQEENIPVIVYANVFKKMAKGLLTFGALPSLHV